MKCSTTARCVELNQATYPGCYLHRSDPEDVARVEHLTFVCTKDKADAGPNNNWKAPDEAKTLMESCFAGCMRGRTMYVIPYCMGPIDSPYARCGVEITDSAYVVANMYLMTRIGKPALKRIEKDKTFVKGLALDRRARPRAPLHRALPRGAHDHELRLGLRRQRAARQEVPRAAHRELSGAHRRLARRAHADRRRAEPRRRHALSRVRVPVGVRQDESRDADSAREPARLEGLDARRRHRLDASRRGRPVARDQSGGRATSASCRARTRKRTATPTT